MELTEEQYLAHYGTLRKSGRYPWGSGETQAKRNKMFLDVVENLRRQGMSEAEIAKSFSSPGHPMSRNTLQALKSIAKNEQKQSLIRQIERMHDHGMSNTKIAERLGMPESTVRSLRAPGVKDRADILQATANMLRQQVEEKGAIDVGTDVYRAISLNNNPSAKIGISSTKFDTAVAVLVEEGYKVHTVNVPNIGLPGKFTKQKVLARPDVEWKSLVKNPSLIKPLVEHSPDGGHTYDGFVKPIDVSSKRVKVVYGDEGGSKLDGLIYVRPNVPDLSMGAARYAQVRVSVDGTHYLKGMAVHKDDLPPGADLVFHTNKSNTGNKHDAMKAMEDDPDFPFSAVVRQLKDETNTKATSALNIVNEEGDWDRWSKSLPSQFLSKQSPKLAKTQLDVTYERRSKEFEEIKALTNPVIRKKLLDTFADETDSASVKLKAHYMPGQTTKVLIPIQSIKEGEAFCPSLPNGTRVALVRFPHGGTFEIPEITVNNKNREARTILGSDNQDAIGIHHKVAERLSGADFDGDYVLAIPNNRQDVKSTPALAGLKGFDPKTEYKAYDGMRTVDGGTYNASTRKVEFRDGQKPNPSNMQHLMGNVSNLIADMTIKGANADELARAVRHSMVVIDCEKHVLDFKSSERDHAILALKRRYQAKPDGRPGGASTIISRAKSPIDIPARKPRPAAEGGPIDRATGKKVFVNTGETYVDKRTGKTVNRTMRLRKLEYATDARTLVSEPTGQHIEHIYADFSNRLKALANDSRKESINTQPMHMSDSAKKVYATEVASLHSKLNVARLNAPRERQAQAVGNAIADQKIAANPHLDNSDKKKIRNQELGRARVRCGAKPHPVVISDREWEAIQAGAISTNMLTKIINEADTKQVRLLATPHAKKLMSPSYTARAKSMLSLGYTQAEVAAQLGVSVSTLKASLKGGE